MQCEALTPNLEPLARVAPVRLAVNYRHGWRGTCNADDILEGLVQAHHLYREASDPISSLRRSGALILSGAAPEKSVHISERYVIERVVTDDFSLLTRAAAHHVVPPKLAGDARDNHALGKQRVR